MVRQNLTLINIIEISSIKDVLSSLELIDNRLGDLRLGQFQLFNKAYFIVTNLIRQGINEGYFSNPKFIEQFIVNFAAYYFQAVNKSIGKNPSISAPWGKLNEYAKIKSAPVFVSLMLGASAHINNDLPQLLRKQMQEDMTDGLLGDIAKIDKILMKSGKEIIGLFNEKNKFLDFLKRRFQFMYYRPAMYTILYWRVRAWRNYQKLKKNNNSIHGITNRSIKIANRLLCLSKILAKQFGGPGGT